MAQQVPDGLAQLPRLTPSELNAWQALSELPAPGTIAHIHARLPRSVPYTTLASTLQRVMRKGYAQVEQRGRHQWFSARLTSEAYGRAQLRQLVLRDFAGSYPALVAFCIRQGYLSYAEVEAIFLTKS